MRMRIAILALCVSTLALAGTLAHAAPGDPITGTSIGLDCYEPYSSECKNAMRVAPKARILPKTQQQKSGTGSTKHNSPSVANISGNKLNATGSPPPTGTVQFKR
jgi:hypothetical protein